MKKTILICCMIFFLVGSGGCASILTQAGPLKSELEDGESRPGDFSNYSYTFHAELNRVYLERIPLCLEVREKIRVAQKRPRGLYFIILELPIYGLGFIDMVNAHAISQRSRTETPLGEYETSNKIRCGEPRPAANERLVIWNKREDIEIVAVTDQNGKINLDEELRDVAARVIPIQIHPERNPEFTFFHRYLPGL